MCPCLRIHPPAYRLPTAATSLLPINENIICHEKYPKKESRLYKEMHREVKHLWELWLLVINFYLQPPVCMHILILHDCSQTKISTPVTDSVTNSTRCPHENEHLGSCYHWWKRQFKQYENYMVSTVLTDYKVLPLNNSLHNSNQQEQVQVQKL